MSTILNQLGTLEIIAGAVTFLFAFISAIYVILGNIRKRDWEKIRRDLSIFLGTCIAFVLVVAVLIWANALPSHLIGSQQKAPSSTATQGSETPTTGHQPTGTAKPTATVNIAGNTPNPTPTSIAPATQAPVNLQCSTVDCDISLEITGITVLSPTEVDLTYQAVNTGPGEVNASLTANSYFVCSGINSDPGQASVTLPVGTPESFSSEFKNVPTSRGTVCSMQNEMQCEGTYDYNPVPIRF